MLGKTLQELGFTKPIRPKHISVKEAVFPFNRFPNVDILLGPEMKSTGEVMGIDRSFGLAFAKSQMAAGFKMPLSGGSSSASTTFTRTGSSAWPKRLPGWGFRSPPRGGTAGRLRAHGVPVETILKVSEGRPNVVDHIKNGDIQLVINVSLGRRSSRKDAYHIRRGALVYNVLYTTTISGARA